MTPLPTTTVTRATARLSGQRMSNAAPVCHVELRALPVRNRPASWNTRWKTGACFRRETDAYPLNAPPKRKYQQNFRMHPRPAQDIRAQQ
jgi:hypothetical protein